MMTLLRLRLRDSTDRQDELRLDAHFRGIGPPSRDSCGLTLDALVAAAFTAARRLRSSGTPVTVTVDNIEIFQAP